MLGNLVKGYREWKELGLFSEHELWENARMVFAEVPVDEDQVRGWVPAPLMLETPARATVFIADYPETTFGCVYREAALLLHVRLFGVIPAVYCPWMVVDDDRAMILGREMLGYPKKMARFRFEEKNGKFLGTVKRKGAEVLRMQGTIGEKIDNPPPGIGQRAINSRHLLGLGAGHLLAFRPRETVHEANNVDLRVTLSSSPDDPVGVATGEAVNATIRTCDIGANLLVPPVRIWPVGPGFQARLMRLRVH